MTQRQTLNRKRDQILRRLPPLTEMVRGSLIERYLRCGKASCHCADRKDKGHRAFYLTVTIAAGRTEQVTVPVSLVPVVQGWIENYERWWKAVEDVSSINRELLRKRLLDTPNGKRSSAG